MPINAASGRPYRGVNLPILFAMAQSAGYPSGQWATFQQWKGLGATVRKGERASVVVFWKRLDNAEPATDGAEASALDQADEPQHRLLCRGYHVFNAAQVDGIDIPSAELPDLAQRVDAAESFIAATRADIRFGGDRAFYLPSSDFIQIPQPGAFTGTDTSTPAEAFYATLLHELTHWTAHASRSERDLSGRFGSEAYAIEEMTAELGAAFLCGRLGIAAEPRADHAAYIATWLRVLRGDPRAIFAAASKAQQAVDFLCGLQPVSMVP